ncbi:MAG: hypothetical protein PHV02_15640 [Rhodocyclaceae bacterium]|nr:hypothetical protein [Rhodocyclaceae bacterium]
MRLIHLFTLSLLLLLGGCASRGIPLASGQYEDLAARALLKQSAKAHGLAAYQQITDLNVSYSGEWYGLVSRIQPGLIDAGFRQASQERTLLKTPLLTGQNHQGPQGSKQVIRTAGSVQVYYNDAPSADKEALAAAALVADAYRMFLTGPFYFLDNNLSLELAEGEEVEGRACKALLAVRRPGHGLSAEDRYLLFIDSENHLLRRVRFTMEGLESTKGAIAEVDFFDHQTIAGVTWPTRFFERLRKPIPNLPVHDWRMTGLDVNRGLSEADISGKAFSAKAATPAKAIQPSAH